MGVYFGESAMLMRDQSNAKGYFERFQVNEVHDFILRANGMSWVKLSGFDMACLGDKSQQVFDCGMSSIFNECREQAIWGVKDPRICLTFPLWKKHLENPICIFAYRNPCYVAKSLNKRDGFPVEFGLALWEKYNVCGLANIGELPTLFTDFDAITRDPYNAAAKLHAELTELGAEGLHQLDMQEVDALVDRGLVHYRGESAGGECGATPSQERLYEGLRSGEISRESLNSSLPRNASVVLKEHEDLIVYGTGEEELYRKLLDAIEGERKMVLHVGGVSSRIESPLEDRLQDSTVIDVRFSASLDEPCGHENSFRSGDQDGALAYIENSLEKGKPDLLILDRVISRLPSSVELLVSLRRLLAPNVQILVLEQNPRNIISFNKLLNPGVLQTAAGVAIGYQDRRLLTMQELIRAFTVCGYQVVSSDYNIDPRLEKLYRQGLAQEKRSDLHMEKYVLKQVSGKDMQELCANFMLVNLTVT